MIIDLHCHSVHSDDSLLSFEEIARQSKEKGIDGVCITDHETFVDSNVLEELESISNQINIRIFEGAEINTDVGHIITFGIKEYKFGMHNLKFLYEQVAINKGAMIWAHPYRRIINDNETMTPEEFQKRLDQTAKSEIFNYVDAIEVNNGRGSDFQNHFSKKLAQLTRSKMTGASDCHLTKDIGTWATEFERDDIVNTTQLIYEIKKGKYKPLKIN
ncbi:MAG: hypothetical protein CL796_03020 [Chloroflexi bacterium]|nr:hypothetical protein [Chloroflexota bacterium]